jgi:hypothetical protein
MPETAKKTYRKPSMAKSNVTLQAVTAANQVSGPKQVIQ